MPVYEFECPGCDHLTQISRPIASRDDLMTCKKCYAAMQRILSGFSIGSNSNSCNFSEKLNEPKNAQPANHRGITGIRINGENCFVKSNTFRNLQTGISLAEGTKLDMSDNKFINTPNPIEVTNK